MRRVKGADTTPEVVFRKALWAAGLRFRKHRGDLPGKPDIVFASRRLAVFVDGDYWHGNQWRRRGLPCLEAQFSRTKSRDYWLGKIRRNGLRDCRATAELLDLGWTVLRFWESDVRKRLGDCVETTLAAFRGEAPSCPPECARLPRKTVLSVDGEAGHGLADEGWSDPPDASDVTLVALSIGRRAPGGFSRALRRTLPALSGPPLLLVEGPVGLMTRDAGRGLGSVARGVAKLGYGVDAFLLNAADFGGRNRRSLFLVARHSEAFAPSPADGKETPEPDRLRPAALLSRLNEGARLRRLPEPRATSPAASMAAWIARHYLNPCVEEAIRGAALSGSPPGVVSAKLG